MIQQPLAVDLDGSLIRTDLLHESATRFVVARPWSLGSLAAWARKGPGPLKAELASAISIDVGVLPYREDVVDWLREEADSGRVLVLASASDQRLVQAVADHLGIFDEAMGSTAGRNLKGAEKANALCARFGEKGFEYVGNHRDDLPVWATASVAHVITSSKSLRAAAGSVSELGRSFDAPKMSLRTFATMLRPYQWVKNILVLLALVTAQRLNDPVAVWHAVAGVVIFSVLASSVYVLNDLADLDHDRHHPTKRRRPLAAGTVSLLTAWLVWPTLMAAAFALSALLEPWKFTLVLFAYYVTTVAYTFWLKRQPIADVVTLAGLYSVRVIAGVAAIAVSVSIWLLTFSLFFFLSLALIKRVSELERARRDAAMVGGRGYRNADLELLSSYGVSSGIAAVVIFSLYVNDRKTAELYQAPEILWGALPILLAWTMRTWLIAHRGELDEDPILFAAKDRWSLLAGLGIAAVFVAAKVVHG